MSGTLAALSIAQGVLIRPLRAIGFVIPNVVIEEQHEDQLVITEHPVEMGAAITDHAFKRPAEVTIRCGWSNSTAGAPGYVQAVYQALLALQASRLPFVVVTGKRIYRNMLLSSLSVTTNGESEYALMTVARCREIIIVQTQTTTVPAQQDHALPEKTAAPADQGTKQPAPSILSQSPNAVQSAFKWLGVAK